MYHFYEFSKRATSILDTGYERVHYFVRGLKLSLCMSTQSLVAAGRSFVKVSDHA